MCVCACGIALSTSGGNPAESLCVAEEPWVCCPSIHRCSRECSRAPQILEQTKGFRSQMDRSISWTPSPPLCGGFDIWSLTMDRTGMTGTPLLVWVGLKGLPLTHVRRSLLRFFWTSGPFWRSAKPPGGDAGGKQSSPSGLGTHQAPPGGAEKNIFPGRKHCPADKKITDGPRVGCCSQQQANRM